MEEQELSYSTGKGEQISMKVIYHRLFTEFDIMRLICKSLFFPVRVKKHY